MTRLTRPGLILAALVSGGCIGTTPEEQARAEQGDYEDGDEEHRPGQPCLVCHGDGYNPGGDVFVLAGTVYRRPDDPGDMGTEGAIVTVRDAVGHELEAQTNRVGNFMVQVEAGLGQPRQLEHGRLAIPWTLQYPLQVRVRRGDLEVEMESLVWREGSCAGCHSLGGSATNREPRVFLEELP